MKYPCFCCHANINDEMNGFCEACINAGCPELEITADCKTSTADLNKQIADLKAKLNEVCRAFNDHRHNVTDTLGFSEDSGTPDGWISELK